jgi:hypothetical protein
MYHHKRKKAGFSILELLVYIVIVSTVLVVVAQMFSQLLIFKAEAESGQGLYNDASKILLDFTKTVLEAQEVDSPGVGLESGSLSLDGGATSYNLVEGDILKNGVRLNSDLVRVESLVYRNLADSTESTPSMSLEMELFSQTVKADQSEREFFRTTVNLR